jgi:hypothetical protein
MLADEGAGIGKPPQKAAESLEGDNEVHGCLQVQARKPYLRQIAENPEFSSPRRAAVSPCQNPDGIVKCDWGSRSSRYRENRTVFVLEF